MNDTSPPGNVHFANRPLGEPYACGLVGYPNGPSIPNAIDPEMVSGCAVCEAEATVAMYGVQKKLVAIFMGCGCEVTSHAHQDAPGVVMVPHSCFDHGGYFIGEHPDAPEYSVIVAPDEEVRRIWQETLDELDPES